ncbi:hypothetical protein V1524DRAFT_387052 [Lipomyces starkeyi]
MIKYARARDRVGPTYTRKRAVTACQVCRFRKTKCDNSRPVCGFCQKSGERCVFEAPEINNSTFDPASLAILDRLSEISYQINQTTALTRLQASNSPDSGDINIVTYALSEQKILEWPIFDRSHDMVSVIDSLCATDNYNDVVDTGDMPTNEVCSLIDRFWLNVHIKNPILELQSLRASAAKVMKDGFGFDPSSCLLLYVCALGAISTPYTYPQTNVDRSSIAVDYSSIQHSLRYFNEASKRLSAVPHYSVLEIQCYILSGIYQMFIMRPLDAWRQFHTASVSCQIYLKRNRYKLSNESSGSVEQRLFWTVLKSECEIRAYLPVPSSGIVNFESPSMFPSPPSIVNSNESSDHSMEGLGDICSNIDASVERKSWYYYLTEIVLRKIQNCVIDTLYRETNECWTAMPFPTLFEIISEFETQLTMCHRQLVDEISFDINTLHKHDEIITLLQGRFWETYNYLYRPVLYCAIHTDVEVTYPQYREFISTVLDKLFRYSSQSCCSIYYRHHGTWLLLRSMFNSSLIILAGLKSGKLLYNDYVKECFMDVLKALRYWETEAPDLKEIIRLLDNLWTEIRMSLGVDGIM